MNNNYYLHYTKEAVHLIMRNDTLYFLHQKYFQHFFQILDFVITDEKQFRGIHCSIVVIVFGG